MTKKLFISLPMRGKDPAQLLVTMNDICERVNAILTDEGPFELINTLWEEPEPEDINHHTYYLGKSITALSQADLVVFHPNWHTAQGCVIEYEICKLYKIPYYMLSFDPSEGE